VKNFFKKHGGLMAALAAIGLFAAYMIWGLAKAGWTPEDDQLKLFGGVEHPGAITDMTNLVRHHPDQIIKVHRQIAAGASFAERVAIEAKVKDDHVQSVWSITTAADDQALTSAINETNLTLATEHKSQIPVINEPLKGKDGVIEARGGPSSSNSEPIWPKVVGFAITIGMAVFFYRMFQKGMGQQNQKGKMTLSRLDETGEKVRFEDVAGIDDEMDKIVKLVFNIRNPQMLAKLNGRMPAGVMLVGKPGTGKSFLVQAMAGELGSGGKPLPILTCSGSDFVEMYVGVGASRVRDAFAQARALRDSTGSWVILFVDEFDAVGKSRAAGGAGGGNDERDQTVAQLLVEINGTQNDNSRILLIVATNQPDKLDPALIRAGRLGDVKIEIGEPDRQGRIDILNVKLKKVPAAKDVNVEALADEMPGLVGADIDTLVRKRGPEFAMRRLLQRVPHDVQITPEGFSLDTYFQPEDFQITHEDLWKALEEMTLGAINETKGRRVPDEIKELLAYHELGHFTLMYRKFLQTKGEKMDWQYGEAISSISILGPNGVGGFVKPRPGHSLKKTAKHYKGYLAIALAGNRAERMFIKDKTGGCSNDLKQATRVIKAMLLEVNMSDCNNNGWKLPALSVDFSGQSRFLGGEASHAAQYGMSPDSASQVDAFIALFMDEAEAEADAYLKEEEGWIRWVMPKLVKAERVRIEQMVAWWNEYHEQYHPGVDYSTKVAWAYAWDENHAGLEPGKIVERKMPEMPGRVVTVSPAHN